MQPPQTILSLGSSSPVAGTELQLPGISKEITMIVSATGSPTSFSVDLEANQTDSVWVVLGTLTAPGAITVNTHWVRYIRANLTSVVGGTNPIVRATVAAA